MMTIKKPQTDLRLEQANVIVAFDYRTDETVSMQMESLAVAGVHIASQSMSVSAQKIRMSGTLRFKQTAPIQNGVNGGRHDVYN